MGATAAAIVGILVVQFYLPAQFIAIAISGLPLPVLHQRQRSPTDVMPMSRWAKTLMMVRSAISLIAASLVIARAVNVLE
ncbi:hypothetical protein [Nocardia sp. NPDC046763]|uniref:hypothetical protein n=1 Tax=Nocardia sp. NPDC046763 TaxID=3155256 RepID=UPI0033C6C242